MPEVETGYTVLWQELLPKPVWSKAKDFSCDLCSYFNAKTPLSPDKTADTATSTLVLLAADRLAVASSVSFRLFSEIFRAACSSRFLVLSHLKAS